MHSSAGALWPSFGGYVGAAMLTGVSLGQGVAYIRWFPSENRSLKVMVLIILFADAFQTAMALSIGWNQFISCRRSDSHNCTIKSTWQHLVEVPTATLTTFGVEVFYCHRVWIVSGHNRIVTGLVGFFAAAQLILGAVLAGILIASGKVAVLFHNPYLPCSYGASAVCDIIISASMIFYLREARTGVRRSGNGLQRMMVIFVQMSVLTCLTAICVALSYVIKSRINWEALPSEIRPKLYVNSMLAVLNARKTIRDDEREDIGPKIVVPTIRTIRADVSV